MGGCAPTVLNERPPEPFFIRTSTGDATELWHTNLVPNYYELDDFQVRTPTDVIGRLDAATRSYLESPDTRARLRVMGAETATEGSMEFRQLVRSESEKWGAVIRKANIRVD